MSNKGIQENMSKVLVLAGLPGSGKSVASDIAKSMNIPVIIMGNVIRRETAERGLEPNSRNIGMVASDLREKFGDDVVLQRIWPIISQELKNNNLVLIDGMRSIAERDALVQLMGFEPEILAILASENIRNSRLIQRKRSDDLDIESTKENKKNLKQVNKEKNHVISERDAREKGWGVESLLERANYKIDNEDSMELFRISVKALLERLNNPD
ncbi:MAG: AAA family ATPase [Candidatus Thermoplasmatota archaeon]|nr:AAA family ATPase [Candidatus Thermoplasmatota archaeon]MEC7543859.1 AAA family ATPase [Candidatus Thermoplasmatota archaeon]|tara:strand:+ start:9983 stop:10621 length:639 start_codon:yes stop_codon:yes gene_type:complete